MHTILHARKNNEIKDSLVEGAFAVASTDNIDFLQSHAAVYCGSQHHSWHAASVQLVQPKPRSLRFENPLQHIVPHTVCASDESSSPTLCPLKHCMVLSLGLVLLLLLMKVWSRRLVLQV